MEAAVWMKWEHLMSMLTASFTMVILVSASECEIQEFCSQTVITHSTWGSALAYEWNASLFSQIQQRY